MMRQNAARVKARVNMNTYTEELQQELDRVVLKGNPDKDSFRKLASIIFRMDARIAQLEEEVLVDEKPQPEKRGRGRPRKET